MDIIAAFLYISIFALFFFQTLFRMAKSKSKVDILYRRETVISDSEVFSEMKSRMRKIFPVYSIGFVLAYVFAIEGFNLIKGKTELKELIMATLPIVLSLLTWKFILIVCLFGPFSLLALIPLVGAITNKLYGGKVKADS